VGPRSVLGNGGIMIISFLLGILTIFFKCFHFFYGIIDCILHGAIANLKLLSYLISLLAACSFLMLLFSLAYI
jgi:hypothetical protein